MFYSENELFFKKGRKKRVCLSLHRNEHVLSWVRHLDSKEWMLDLCLELFGWKKILFIDLNQTRALHIWVQNQVFKKIDSRNSNISRSSSPSKSEHAFYMTEKLELLTFFYIILLKKLPRNGTFFLVGGNCFPLLKYYRAGSCAPYAHMSKQQHKNQLKLLIMVLYDSEWRIYSFTLNILSKVVF